MKLGFLLAVLFSISVAAQEAKKPAKKPAIRQTAHTKATPEQMRSFRQLEEKEKLKK